MIVRRNNQFAAECYIKMATNCVQNGEYCDSEEEAIEWAEYECWIFSGEGWICADCHEKVMENMVKMRKIKGTDGPKGPDDEDGLGNDLEVGIDTVR